MSQPLTGVFLSSGKKTEVKKARRRPRGPEWEKALGVSRFQIFMSAAAAAVNFNIGITCRNIPCILVGCQNLYLALKGIRNYQVTARSADDAPLRELLGPQAPANDNLTPDQSMSNSFNLVGRSMTSIALAGAATAALQAFPVVVGTSSDHYTVPAIVYSASKAVVFHRLAKDLGPAKLPPLFSGKGKGPGMR